jgi:hypothetical protein
MRLGRFTEANEAFTLLLDATAPYLHGKHNRRTGRQAGCRPWDCYTPGIVNNAGDVIGIISPLCIQFSALFPSKRA